MDIGKKPCSCKIIVKNTGGSYTLTVIDKLEILDTIEGEIRYFNDYYRKETGLKKVKDRMVRIIAVCDFIKKQNFTPVFGHLKKETKYGKSFISTVQPFLFPETMTNKPEEYKTILKEKSGNFDDNWSLVEDRLWNKLYTKKIFPEYLQTARDSGTLWRDFEESKGLMMMMYNLDYYFNTILTGSTFEKE